MRQAVYKTTADRIAHLSKNYRDNASCLNKCSQEIIAVNDNYVRVEVRNLSGEGCHSLGIAAAETKVDLKVGALDPAVFAKSHSESLDAALGLRIVLGRANENPNTPHGMLLSLRHKRPRRRTPDKCDEVPPPHGSLLCR